MCVDLIWDPSGRLMTIGLWVGLTFFTGAPGIMKFPVAPASATAMSFGMSIPPT